MIKFQSLNKELYPMPDIWNIVVTGQFSQQYENKDTNFRVEAVSDLCYELYYRVDIAANQILT